MERIEGTVERIYRDRVETKFGTKDKVTYVINGTKYSGWKDYAGIEEGSPVSGTFVRNGNYMNIKHLEPSGGPVAAPSGGSSKAAPATHAFPVGARTRERSICRQTALKAAVEMCRGEEHATPALVLSWAEVFEGYVTGDADLAAAKEALEDDKVAREAEAA